METKMVSNLLVPMISKQFKLKNFSRQSIKKFDRKSRGLSYSQEFSAFYCNLKYLQTQSDL